MKIQEHTTTSNQTIKIFDDLFTYGERSEMFAMMRDIPFQFWSAYDTLITDQSSSFIIKSMWRPEDFFYKFKMFDCPGANVLKEELKDYKLHRTWVNLYTPLDQLRYHSDMFKPGYKSMLYYVNLHWEPEWDSPTIWRNQDLSEIEFVSPFIPGRVVLFDSDIPHKATHAPLEARQYRFTLNTVWEPK